jgi:hypothetical protein
MAGPSSRPSIDPAARDEGLWHRVRDILPNFVNDGLMDGRDEGPAMTVFV